MTEDEVYDPVAADPPAASPDELLERLKHDSRPRLRVYIGAATGSERLEPALIPERVMVCMSSNAAGPRDICTGARIAGRLGA